MTTEGPCTSKHTIDKLVAENARRYKKLLAEYDPVSGKDAPGERMRLELSDFAIPVQYIPAEMMKVKLIKLLSKFGSINEFLKGYPLKNNYTHFDIERKLRQIRHKYDFVFWAYFQIHIIDKEGRGEIRFRLNYAQIQVLNECERLRKAGLPINIVICKARQWGGSTFCIFYQTWLALEWRESHAFSVCAQTVGVATSITNMLDFAFKKYMAWDLGLPDSEKIHLSAIPKSSEFVIKDSHGNTVRHNKIRIGSIIAPDNLRGLPGSGAHFSETGVWPDTPSRRPEDLIKSITGGILPRPYTMQVIESTPKGSGNAFHRAYLNAKSGGSNFKAIFIPWFYIPHDTLPVEDPVEFAKWLLENKFSNHPGGKWKDPGKYYWRLWELGATFEGINWYRFKRLEYDDFADMASEAPSDDIEAFQHSGSKVFNIYDVADLRKDCHKPSQEGFLFSDALKGEHVLKNIHFEPSRDGYLKIWAFPENDPISDRYLVSVDVGGRSKDADWSVIRVLDRFPMIFGGKPELVAQMRYHTDPDLLSYDALRIAEWYCHAKLVIESNTLETKDRERDTDGNMTEFILDIIARFYDNLYARRQNTEDIKKGEPKKYGFHTNTATKPAIIGHLVECVRDHMWTERDIYCCDELEIYEKNNKGQFNAPPGKGNYDDVLMATAIGLWVCFRELPIPAWKDQSECIIRHSIDQNSAAHI